jgi:hypothetical protein
MSRCAPLASRYAMQCSADHIEEGYKPPEDTTYANDSDNDQIPDFLDMKNTLLNLQMSGCCSNADETITTCKQQDKTEKLKKGVYN